MMTIDWDDEANRLKIEVNKHGGFLTMQRTALSERFGIGRLAEKISKDLLVTLNKYEMIVIPHLYYVQGSILRIYDIESTIGKIALAVAFPQDVPETSLVDTVNLHKRATDGACRRSISVPWLKALEVFLQRVIGKPPADWEELDDSREPYQLIEALAASLELAADIIHAKDTIRMAGAVWACRPQVSRWEGASPALTAIIAEAARKQKYIFDGMLLDAAKYLLGGAKIPSHEVDLGRLGLRYRCEIQGEI